MNLPPAPEPGPGVAGSNSAGEAGRNTRSVDRKKLDDIFGDVLPDTTNDEREAGGSAGYSEDWYRENRPPHHGG